MCGLTLNVVHRTDVDTESAACLLDASNIVDMEPSCTRANNSHVKAIKHLINKVTAS